MAGDALSFLPPGIRGIATKALVRTLKKQGVRSIVLSYDDTKNTEDDEEKFDGIMSKDNLLEKLRNLQSLEKAAKDKESRFKFLDDFYRKQMGLPTRAQEEKEKGVHHA